MSDTPFADIELEQAVLGLLLLQNDYIQKCPTLLAEHFYDPVHARIFEVIINKINAGKVASPVTLKFALKDDAGLAELGGPKYLVRMHGAALASASISDYAEIIISLWSRREMSVLIDEAKARLSVEDEEPETIISDLESHVSRITANSSKKPLIKSAFRGMNEAIETINRAYQGDTGVSGLSTGLDVLDKATGGFASGELILIGGRPSMSKTALALNIAFKAAIRGEGVFFASLEMLSEQLFMRTFSQSLANSSNAAHYSDMRRGVISENQFRAIIEDAQSYKNLPMYTSEPDCRDIKKLQAAIRRAHYTLKSKGTPLKAIFVDYIQLMQVHGARTKIEKTDAAGQFLKETALKYNVPVVALSQLSRQVEARDNKRPVMSDLRDSGSLEQDADMVIFPFREEYYLEREKPADHNIEARMDWEQDLKAVANKVELGIAKQRAGSISTPVAYCDVANNYFADKGPDTQEDMDL